MPPTIVFQDDMVEATATALSLSGSLASENT